jgi:cyanophycinase-like exopeptidase
MISTNGPIALLGGGEHRDGTRPIDRWLMEATGASKVKVAVLPVASSARKMPSTAALARSYWRSLGAAVSFVVPEPGRQVSTIDGLDDPDIIVLTGGFPDRLISSLGISPLWDRVLALWQTGAALTGSSAGSMAMFDWRLRLLPPRPFELIPGLGPLSGYVSLPHYDRYVAAHPRRQAWLHRLAHGFRGHGIVGIDEATALAGRSGDYHVLGRGAVTVLEDHRWTTHPSGARVPLDLLGATPAAETPPARQLAVA